MARPHLNLTLLSSSMLKTARLKPLPTTKCGCGNTGEELADQSDSGGRSSATAIAQEVCFPDL